jgi:CYTH domain-containing protein
VAEQWLHGAADSLIAGAHAVADRMEALASEVTPASPGDADKEIERKYLLRELPPEVGSAPTSEIEQGYLPGARVAERLRRIVDVEVGNGDGHERLLRTVKLGNGLSRTEVEEETPREVFDAMWPLTEGRRVRKRRYRVHDGPLVWEIDEFLDRELLIAEVELGRLDAVVEIPAWLERHVVREVTAEPEYSNQNLAH